MKIALILLVFLNCQMSKNSRNYEISNHNYVETNSNKILGILPFVDSRLKNDETQFINLFLNPFYFFETVEYKNKNIYTKLIDLESLEYGIRNEYRKSNFFKEVYLIQNIESEKADYFIKAKILKSNLNKSITLYGLTIFGVYLWLVGLPAIYFDLEMEIEFSLLDKNKNLILTKNYISKVTEIEGLYYGKFDSKINSVIQKQYILFYDEIVKQNK